MEKIVMLRDKYDLHMTMERYISAEENPADAGFIRR
jgi:hypothetical protein